MVYGVAIFMPLSMRHPPARHLYRYSRWQRLQRQRRVFMFARVWAGSLHLWPPSRGRLGFGSFSSELLKPEAKRDSFFLLSHILHRFTPNPSTMLYHTFAFVTCRNSAERSVLVDRYLPLLVPSDGSYLYRFHNERRRPTYIASFTAF